MIKMKVYCVIIIFAFMCTKSDGMKSKLSLELHFDERDLLRYLRVVDRVISFYTENKHEIDVPVYFGLFLANVNIKYSVLNAKKINPSVQILLDRIILKNDKLISFYHHKVNSMKIEDDENMNYRIYPLFSNEDKWLRRMKRFRQKYSVLFSYTYEELSQRFGDIKSYNNLLWDFEQGIPTPNQSDVCLASLASNLLEKYRRCDLEDGCIDILRNGTDFGYAITHRLLHFILARYGVGCRIFSKEEDERLSKQLCSKCFAEVQYIAYNKFALVDIMFEMISFCALEGHVPFLRRSWLEELRCFQTSYGCFRQSIRKEKIFKICKLNYPWKPEYRNDDYDISDGECGNHVTAVAVSTYAIAARYIIENNF
ncbi:UPF0764 protein C16orf89-like isoform X2 [Leptidea sinapis]|uniref:UPF0764 protein C16orf89-like isoform X2 n=1 Tax=Leptidea sinapis TaxID=189913 RepID=UPI0021C46305|nr:UPF0764 protein C16orf89-like isoform X2 [Leptidea sinapis]